MKKLISVFIIFCMTMSFAYAVPAITEQTKEESISLLLDGQLLEFETQPILINNQVMVPMRPFFESLGAQITWVEETRTVAAMSLRSVVWILIYIFSYRELIRRKVI